MRVARNELRARYAGSLLGQSWSILSPALLLVIYATVYAFVLKIEVPGLDAGQYVVYIFSGLVPFLMTSESLVSGVTSVVGNRHLLHNASFPIDLAGPKAVLLSQPSMIAGQMAVLGGLVLVRRIGVWWLLTPFLWASLVAVLIGVAWIASVLNVVFRDLQNIIASLMILLLISSPFAYTPEMVPASLRPLIDLNPFAIYTVSFQRAQVLGRPPTLPHAIAMVVMPVLSMLVGNWMFSRGKRVIADHA